MMTDIFPRQWRQLTLRSEVLSEHCADMQTRRNIREKWLLHLFEHERERAQHVNKVMSLGWCYNRPVFDILDSGKLGTATQYLSNLQLSNDVQRNIY